MKYLLSINYIVLIAILSNTQIFSQNNSQIFTQEIAEQLIKLPLNCVEQEYPNKLQQTLDSKSDLASPKELHPAFYGCYDWHSAVHGHWLLVYFIKNFDQLSSYEVALNHLRKSLSADNIKSEIAYFQRIHEKSFERTYGWAWVFKLQQELDTWNHPDAKYLANNLRPLTLHLRQLLLYFLPKLTYPVRVGTHTNTSFAISFALDYAIEAKDLEMIEKLNIAAQSLYANDKKYQLAWEPSGTDFFSIAMMEIDLMSKVYDEKKFVKWLVGFLPELKNRKFDLKPVKVSDRTDGHLVHLDGLNFSRAWVMYDLAHRFPNTLGHIEKVADSHLAASLPSISDGNYEGEHWLATFAAYCLKNKIMKDFKRK